MSRCRRLGVKIGLGMILELTNTCLNYVISIDFGLIGLKVRFLLAFKDY